MSEDEGFLERWSRRKQAQKTAAADADTAKTAETAESAREKPSAPTKPPEPVDLSSLPPIDSLTAESDYTVFLRPGIPQSMQVAALRRLWLTDPSVRNYEALVEYAWDFNAPGYGQLLPTDDVAKLARAVFGELEKPREAPGDARVAEADLPATDKAAVPTDNVRRSDGPRAAPMPEPVAVPETPAEPAVAASTPAPARRRHGAALPRPGEGDETG